jgi:hypothetical protein
MKGEDRYKSILERCVDVLRERPHLTAYELSQTIGVDVAIVTSILVRNCIHPHALIKRREGPPRKGRVQRVMVWEYSLFHEKD